jgi:hypothetical protein
MVVGAPCRPTSFAQFWEWANKFMPHHKQFILPGYRQYDGQSGK